MVVVIVFAGFHGIRYKEATSVWSSSFFFPVTAIPRAVKRVRIADTDVESGGSTGSVGAVVAVRRFRIPVAHA
jgi:hypothetical protein